MPEVDCCSEVMVEESCVTHRSTSDQNAIVNYVCMTISDINRNYYCIIILFSNEKFTLLGIQVADTEQ